MKPSAEELSPQTQELVAEHVLPPAVDEARTWPQVPGCRIVSEIACGGMAVLYRGVQESLGRPVAIKALRSDIARLSSGGSDGPDWRDRFVREARILSLLDHENLVRVHDLVALPDGPLYIIMELCEGIDLLDVLTAVPVLPAEIAARIALEAARALGYIHARDILHRDVKPANLLLTRRGGVKLIDFGTAWDPMNPVDLRGDEVGLGTPSYMSPEQALGRPLDHRSDELALGIVLYQMLAGRKPFVASNDGDGPGDGIERSKQILHQVVHCEPPPLAALNPDVPKQLVRIVERCLQKDPRRRFDGMDALIAALKDCVPDAGEPALLQFLLEKQLLPAGTGAGLLPIARSQKSARRRIVWLHRLFAHLRL